MGGNALKNCETRRYSREEYFDLEDEVINRLLSLGFYPVPIKAYKNKESYGDMDILIRSDFLPENWVDVILDNFKPKEHYKNSDVLSFEYNQFQIDLIITSYDDWISSQQYFGYNDLGNLLGRVAHNLGLKLGHDGLSYLWRDGTQVLHREILLRDYKDILPVLGYSYERYEQGFNTLEDIFKFVVSSRFFNKEIYQLQNRNHAARTRDKKRKTYTEFLKWIEDYKETYEQDSIKNTAKAWREKHNNKNYWLPYLFIHIPCFRLLDEQVKAKAEEDRKFKANFNGDLVHEWTGLEGKELGKFMSYLKPYIDKNKEAIVNWEFSVQRYVELHLDRYLNNV